MNVFLIADMKIFRRQTVNNMYINFSGSRSASGIHKKKSRTPVSMWLWYLDIRFHFRFGPCWDRPKRMSNAHYRINLEHWGGLLQIKWNVEIQLADIRLEVCNLPTNKIGNFTKFESVIWIYDNLDFWFCKDHSKWTPKSSKERQTAVQK